MHSLSRFIILSHLMLVPALAGCAIDDFAASPALSADMEVPAAAAASPAIHAQSTSSLQWQPVAPMIHPRAKHRVSLRESGELLVFGGFKHPPNRVHDTVERYDLDSGTWELHTTAPYYLFHFSLTELADGRVLLATYEDGYFYTPATDTWSDALMTGYDDHSATLLADGQVVRAGGYDDFRTSTFYTLYDPATDSESPGGLMVHTRAKHTATLLDDGRVLLAGGWHWVPDPEDDDELQQVPIADAEIYDPATYTASPAASMHHARTDHRAVRLADGRVLVSSDGTAEIYDPATDTWTLTSPPGASRQNHTLTLLPSGRVIAVGGGTRAVEVYDVAEDSWIELSHMAVPRSEHSTTMLPDLRLLVAGGWEGTPDVDPAHDLVEILALGSLEPGEACAIDDECASGACTGGVCCDQACDGPCEACLASAGAVADGTCTPVSGIACDDGDLCTDEDTCQEGVCAGTPRACDAPGDCQEAACDPETGTCSIVMSLPDGSECEGGECDAGECVPDEEEEPTDPPNPPQGGCQLAAGGAGQAGWLALAAALLLVRTRRRAGSRGTAP